MDSKKKRMLDVESDLVTVRELYDLLDKKMGEVFDAIKDLEKEVKNTQENVANINGRLMIIPVLISTAVSAFFLIINLVLSK